ncbi:hypothetical protein [Vibrio phage phiKT1019]|nr:hypothetical protein [Vibrio phage phiKT1019]
MITPFKNMFFIIRAYQAVQRDSMIKDHRDVIMLENLAKELSIDENIVASFTLNEPWVLLNGIRDELILKMHELMSYMEGVDTYVPAKFEDILKGFNYDDMCDFCPDMSFDHAGFLYHITPKEDSDEVVDSGELAMHLANFRIDLDSMEAELKKEYEKDLDLVYRCNREMMFIFAIFEHVHTKGLDLFMLDQTPSEIWYKKFKDGVEALDDILESGLLEAPENMTKEQRERTNENMKTLDVDGMEGFWSELDQSHSLHLLKLTGNEDFKEDIKNMASKAAEMLNTALKSLKTRFEERKKEGSKEATEIKKAIDAAIDKISGMAGEPDAGQIKQLQQRLEKAGFKAQADKLNGVTTYTQLSQALSTISGEFSSMISEMKEAEEKLREAESKVKEASTPPSGANEGANETTKGQIKAQMSEAQKTAKELMKAASESIGESMKSLSMLRGIKATLDRISESGKEKKVDGQESWML